MDVSIPSWLRELWIAIWGQWQVKFLAGHILLNVVVAIAATLRSGEFVIGKVPEFLWRKALPLIAVYAVFELVGGWINFDGLGTVVWASLELLLLNDTLDNLKLLGIDFVPDWATKERAGP